MIQRLVDLLSPQLIMSEILHMYSVLQITGMADTNNLVLISVINLIILKDSNGTSFMSRAKCDAICGFPQFFQYPHGKIEIIKD